MLSKQEKLGLTRRAMLQSAAAGATFGPSFKTTEGSASAQENVNRDSAPRLVAP
jgi:hypothetical protein